MMQIMLLSFDFFERFVCFFKKKELSLHKQVCDEIKWFLFKFMSL